MGPCLCGDPYCWSCGDPALAMIDAFCDALENIFGPNSEIGDEEATEWLMQVYDYGYERGDLSGLAMGSSTMAEWATAWAYCEGLQARTDDDNYAEAESKYLQFCEELDHGE